MANMYKMAKAFGRAMNSRVGRDGKAAKAINRSEIADKANTPGIYKDKDMDAVHAYRRGQNEGTENFWDASDIADERAFQNMDPDAKRIWENYDYDYERSYGPNAAYQRAVELAGVEDAPSDINAFREKYNFSAEDSPEARKSDLSRQISRLEDKQSDAALNKDFEQEFDRAVKQHTLDDPNRGKWSEDEVRNQAIDMLKSGADISDVLRFLRGDIDNVNIPD